MPVKTEEGTRLAGPCKFCGGPRVLLTDKEHAFTEGLVLNATICLRCDGPVPTLRFQSTPKEVDPEPPKEQP